jgi:hypothetical protein
MRMGANPPPLSHFCKTHDSAGSRPSEKHFAALILIKDGACRWPSNGSDHALLGAPWSYKQATFHPLGETKCNHLPKFSSMA